MKRNWVIITVFLLSLIAMQGVIRMTASSMNGILGFNAIETAEGRVTAIDCKLVNDANNPLFYALILYLSDEWRAESMRPQVKYSGDVSFFVVLAKDQKTEIDLNGVYLVRETGEVVLLTDAWDPAILKKKDSLAGYVSDLLDGQAPPHSSTGGRSPDSI